MLIDDSLNLRRKLAGERVGGGPLAAEYTDEIAFTLECILPRYLRGVGRRADQRAKPCKILDLDPLQAGLGKVVPEHLQHVGAFLVTAANGIAEGLADFGGADEGLALPGQHKNDPALTRYFEQISLRAGPPENKVAAPDEVELVGRADAAVFEQTLGPWPADVQHAIMLTVAAIF